MDLHKIIADLRYDNIVLTKRLDEAIRVLAKISEEEAAKVASLPVQVNIADADLWLQAAQAMTQQGMTMATLTKYVGRMGIAITHVSTQQMYSNSSRLEIVAQTSEADLQVVVTMDVHRDGSVFLVSLDTRYDPLYDRGFY